MEAPFELRPAYPVAQVDPLDIAPNPGPMGQMYIGAREAYPDGMTLACANPIKPYEQLVVEYETESQKPGFSDVAFFNANFVVTPPDDDNFIAKPGQSLEEYMLEMRPKFIYPSTEQDTVEGHFDIWLPRDRSVAGAGRFGRHSFLWDGFQMAKGYAADGEWQSVLNVVDNTEYQINRFGYPLNGSAEFYVTRAQPDYFAHEVRMLADRIGPEALVRYLPAMEKNHRHYWLDGYDELSKLPLDGKVHAHRTLVRLPDGSFLNRYWDDAEGPRLESYKEDVELGEMVVAGLSGAIREARLAKVYKDLRAGAASGWDYSSRWFEDGSTMATINTTDILPVDLNSLMAYNEETLIMAWEAAAASGAYDPEFCMQKVAEYQHIRAQRIDAMNIRNWDPEAGIYRDHNFVKGTQTSIVSAAMAYPLYVGISNIEQTFGTARALERELLYPAGIIATTTENSQEQWDGGQLGGTRSKNVWAPPNWAAMRGLARMAHKITAAEVAIDIADKTDVEPLLTLAETVKKNYMWGIEEAFDEHGIVPEKHRGDNPRELANGGEYELVKVLAMPIETYRAMEKTDPRDAKDHLPMARLALEAS